MEKYIKRVLLTQEQIEEKCKELGKWVDDNYDESEELVIVGILNGVVPFFAQVIKNVKRLHDIDFMAVTSYKGTVTSNGNPTIVKDLSDSIEGKNVLILEDIVDTGRTLKKLIELLSVRRAKSIKVMALLDKKEGREVEFNADVIGFDIEKEFVVGFGLDYNEKFRNLPYIGVFNQKYLGKV